MNNETIKKGDKVKSPKGEGVVEAVYPWGEVMVNIDAEFYFYCHHQLEVIDND